VSRDLAIASSRSRTFLIAATVIPQLACGRSKAGGVSFFGSISWFPGFLISLSVFHSDAFGVELLCGD
jgi:hypothetical protein